MKKLKRLWIYTPFLFLSTVLWAHHGGITLSHGPGAPIETNSPLTLPKGGILISQRFEQVDWQQRSIADPDNKTSFTFYNFGLSYGVTHYLSTSLFVPYAVKRLESSRSARGFGDVKFLFNLGGNFSRNSGFKLNSDEDTAVSLEENKKIYWGLYGGFTLPSGASHEEIDAAIDHGMQPGFRSQTYTVGGSVTKPLIGSWNITLDAAYEIFTERDDMKFGNETRFNMANVVELYGNTNSFLSKLDAMMELNYLQIARDEEGGEGQAASGGKILYFSPGIRAAFPKLWNSNLGVLVKVPGWKSLNEEVDQQGGEGLENYRLLLTLSFYF